MKYIEMRRHMAFEALNILCIMAILIYITRLWPILLLVLIAILVVGLELIYWSRKMIEPIEPLLKLPPPVSIPTEKDVHTMAYQVIQMRVTQFLQEKYPDVRWVWENARAREDILAGNPVFILLNKAGGYRRAKVILHNMQFVTVLLEGEASTKNPQTETESEQPSEPDSEEPIPENYSLVAFQWVEGRILDLNSRCNEAIGKHQSEIKISRDELPVQESWAEICLELERNELPGAVCQDDGILINIKQ